MTNLDKAVEAILSRYSILGTIRARAAAHALEEAGLLMPDLPEPKLPGLWQVDGLEINLVDKDGEVLIEYESDSDYIYGMQTRSLWLNRDQVIAILAAANYAEKEQGNE